MINLWAFSFRVVIVCISKNSNQQKDKNLSRTISIFFMFWSSVNDIFVETFRCLFCRKFPTISENSRSTTDKFSDFTRPPAPADYQWRRSDQVGARLPQTNGRRQRRGMPQAIFHVWQCFYELERFKPTLKNVCSQVGAYHSDLESGSRLTT